MIIIKTPEQINGIRKSCKALARLFEELKPVIRPGVTTKELDAFCVAYIKKIKFLCRYTGPYDRF